MTCSRILPNSKGNPSSIKWKLKLQMVVVTTPMEHKKAFLWKKDYPFLWKVPTIRLGLKFDGKLDSKKGVMLFRNWPLCTSIFIDFWRWGFDEVEPCIRCRKELLQKQVRKSYTKDGTWLTHKKALMGWLTWFTSQVILLRATSSLQNKAHALSQFSMIFTFFFESRKISSILKLLQD